jgi:hypothetical protein
MRLILSRKGFDSSSGGCASPVFPDGSMISLPIPDKTSPVRYRDMTWRNRNLGDIVAKLTKGRQRSDYRAHLDPDLRSSVVPRLPGWRPVLGQHASAQGHLRKRGVARGDVFLFWGLFRAVDADLRWVGPPQHYIWGWLQVGAVVSVDDDVRPGGAAWEWIASHPHLAFPPDPKNTLYIASDRLVLPGLTRKDLAGAGVWDEADDARCLTSSSAARPGMWTLPRWFMPSARPPLSYHANSGRWSVKGEHVSLKAVDRGQEFVLDVDHYPEALPWIEQVVGGAHRGELQPGEKRRGR